jgi:Rod binding domain-containing protein
MLPINSNLPALANGSSPVTPATTAKSKPVESPDQQKIKKSAGEFESILLASMWKSMKDSFKDPKDNDADPAGGTIDDWGIEAMSGAVGKAGGLGIGKLLIEHLQPAAGDQATPTAPSDANVFGNLADRTL